VNDDDISARIDELSRRSLVLAIARYVCDEPSARSAAEGWLDDDERSLLDASTDDLAEAATTGLGELDEVATLVEGDPELREASRVGVAHARLAFPSARSGSFETAVGALTDFLREVGAAPDTLDIH